MIIPKNHAFITILFVGCLLISIGSQSSDSIHSLNAKHFKELTLRTLDSDVYINASGTIIPKRPPVKVPVRVEAGNDCIVDLVQGYSVAGTLSGNFEIDYRILIHGPCGVPPGTYDEEWIAHGTFTGKINESSASGNFTYVARVKAGGEVDGDIVFGQGINGELEIKGNFENGKLSYEGWIE